jgi:hypothetical protein
MNFLDFHSFQSSISTCRYIATLPIHALSSVFHQVSVIQEVSIEGVFYAYLCLGLMRYYGSVYCLPEDACSFLFSRNLLLCWTNFGKISVSSVLWNNYGKLLVWISLFGKLLSFLALCCTKSVFLKEIFESALN